MDILYVLCLLTLNYFAVDALLRVGRSNTCPRITDFSGRVKYRRKGTRAVFRCQKKFTRYGSKFATCLYDGRWSDETPLCIKTGCVPLDPSQVNNLDMEIVNGALVKFTCLDNYVLLGETQAYCDGKDWSAPLPRCAAPHELLECDFEEDFCGWTQDDSEEQDWVRNVGPTPTGNTGPKHDHTYGETGTGHYLFFETSSPTMTGHQASLLSPEYTASLNPICFDFWYHILGPDEAGHVGSLEVFVLDQSQFLDDTDIKPLFFIEGNQGNEWHRGEITIDKQDEPYQIVIVATRALNYISDIAVDDVRLKNCSQQTSSEPWTSATKTFTTTIPPKTTTETPTIKSVTTPTTKTSTAITKPIKKFTTIKKITKSSTTVVSKAVTTTVPTLTTTKVYTTTTQSVSSRSSSITKKTKTSKHVMSASTARGSPSSSPITQKPNSIETKKPTHTQAVTEQVIPSITSAATQTFTTTNKPGTTQKGLAPHELLECDFEEDFCGWTQDDSEEQDWVRNVGPTPTNNTGPKHDHTYGETGTGQYLFFETSSPTMTGHQASLLSPEYTASLSPICFDFWYHILGPDEAGHVGSLEVFVLNQSQFLDDTDIKPLFFIEGNQGNEWHRGEITIDKQDEPYKIAIVGTRALSYISDIAIDDVRLNNCSKQTSPEPSTPATKTITTTIPPKTTTYTTTIKSMTTPTTKKLTTITKPIKKLTTIKQTTKSLTTVVSKAVTTTVPTFKTTKVYTTDTQSVSSRPSSTTKKTNTSKQVMYASTARGSPSSSPITQKPTYIETKKPTHTQAVTEPVNPSITSASTQTFTTTNKPGTTQLGLAKTTTVSTKPSSATSIPTSVTFLSTIIPSRSKTVTTMPTVYSTLLKSMTVNKSPNTTKSTTYSTRVISTTFLTKPIRTSTQTSVFSKIPKTTAKSTKKVTTLTSTREPPFTSTTAHPSSNTISESTVSPTTKSTEATTSKAKKETVTPSTKPGKSTEIHTTIKDAPSKTTKVTKPTKRTIATTLSELPTTIAKLTMKATTLTSTREAPFTSTTAQPSSNTISESTVSPTTNKKSTEATTSKFKKETVTPRTKSAKSTEIQTTIKDASSETTKVTKPTKRTNATTLSKRPNASNTTEDKSISVPHGKSQHPEDDISKPLIIGLCGGIVAGLIIIGVIAFVCVLCRKFYTSTHEDNPKPITNSASIQSLDS